MSPDGAPVRRGPWASLTSFVVVVVVVVVVEVGEAIAGLGAWLHG